MSFQLQNEPVIKYRCQAYIGVSLSAAASSGPLAAVIGGKVSDAIGTVLTSGPLADALAAKLTTAQLVAALQARANDGSIPMFSAATQGQLCLNGDPVNGYFFHIKGTGA